MSCEPSTDVNVPWPSPVPPKPAVRDRVEALHELVRRAVLPELELAVQRAVHALVRPRLQPDRDAVLDVVDRVVEDGRAADEEREPDGDEERPPRRDVEHREEDPEVEERASEVVRHEDDEHRRAPDREQRPDVLQLPAGERLALLAQVAGEEQDQEDLRELSRLELDHAEIDPQPRAVHRLSEPRERTGGAGARWRRRRRGSGTTRARGSRGGARSASRRARRRRRRPRPPAGLRRRSRGGRSSSRRTRSARRSAAGARRPRTGRCGGRRRARRRTARGRARPR